MTKSKQKLVKKVFSLIGEEFSKLDKTCIRPDDTTQTIEFNITAKNFSKDGFDLVWNDNGAEVGTDILHSIERKIRIDNNLWFDSSFDKNGREWNLDWSLKKVK